MAIDTQMSVMEYLHTSYRPDREYDDGVLLERNVGKNEHSRLQALLAAWFDLHEEAWQLAVFTEQRVQVSPTRVRIPDVLLTGLRPHPDVLVEPPLLVVEILSPEDSEAETKSRCRDYFAMGVGAAWVIDPNARTAYWSTGPQWNQSLRLAVPGTPVYAELEPLFNRLDRTLLR